MKAEIINDPAQADGYGIIKVDFEDADQPGRAEPITLVIEQFPSKCCLQPPTPGRPLTEARWPQGGPRHQHAPLAQSWEDQTLHLFVGPDIVDALTAKLHALTLLTASSHWPREGMLPLQKKNLKISGAAIIIKEEAPLEITPPPAPDPFGEDLPIIQESRAAPVIFPDPPVTGESPPPAQPEPPNHGSTPENSEPPAPLGIAPKANQEIFAPPAAGPPLKPGRPPKAALKPAPGSSGAAGPNKKVSGVLILLIALAGLMLAGGAAAFWFLFLHEKPASGTDGQAQTETSPATDPARALAEVRALLGREAPQAELELAYQRYDGLAGAEDAVFLLAESLAPNNPSLRMRYAAFFDPTDTRPNGSIIKDAVIAYQEYQKVRGSSHAEAEKRLKALREWAEAQTPLGNWEARKLLEYLNQG